MHDRRREKKRTYGRVHMPIGSYQFIVYSAATLLFALGMLADIWLCIAIMNTFFTSLVALASAILVVALPLLTLFI